MSSIFSRVLKNGLQRQAMSGMNVGRETAIWVFPALVTAGWLLYPCLNQEWLIEIGMEPHPEAGVLKVQDAREARMAARGQATGAASAEEEEEEEAEEEAAAEEEEAGGEQEEEQEADPPAEEEDARPNGSDLFEEDEEEEEEEEASEVVIKPLYTKSTEDTKEAFWDNFSIKAVRMSEDDDDDDDDDDDEDDE